jgi:hypothetical protein
MQSRAIRSWLTAVFTIFSLVAPSSALADSTGPSHVELRKTINGWSLFRENQPFFIQGAGGDASREMLKECGGNSFRLWGADDIGPQLDEAQRLGLAVTVGIWLEHSPGDHHFDYHNPGQVAAQLQKVRRAVERYKDYPAVLIWCVGNEMEGYKDGDDPAIWKAVDDCAAAVHQIDPNHPTMTAIAEIGGKRVACINRYCPNVDIIGVNTYAGGPSLAARYHQMGGTKPYVITEFGPAGTWEVGLNAWRAPIEPTSTAKADEYRATYENSVLPEKDRLCLGSYAFLWGNKQEATATWFGMFLPDGSRLEPVDAMTQFWTGQPPAHHCPRIDPIALDHDDVDPGQTIHARLSTFDPDGNALTARWVLTRDAAVYETAGQFQAVPKSLPDAIASGDTHGAEIHMPSDPGSYWLYAYVYDGHGGAATAVSSLRIHPRPSETAGQPPQTSRQLAHLPLVIYSDDMIAAPYAASGWMGDTANLAIDEKCTTNPHSGAHCLKCQLKAASGFGGIAWQNPANDWGDQDGGYDLTGATKLMFWARGEDGGEVVSFKLGILGNDKKFPDSDHAELPDVTLTQDWKQYSIDLSGKDLTRIKTGFVWVTAASGKPVTFYLDDIKYQ